jgi:hypothetical protein
MRDAEKCNVLKKRWKNLSLIFDRLREILLNGDQVEEAAMMDYESAKFVLKKGIASEISLPKAGAPCMTGQQPNPKVSYLKKNQPEGKVPLHVPVG